MPSCRGILDGPISSSKIGKQLNCTCLVRSPSNPGMAASWWALGAAQMEDGILDEAERNVKEALRLRDSSHFRGTLALILMQRGKLGEAEQVHSQGIELKPESHQRWESYACFLDDLRRHSE